MSEQTQLTKWQRSAAVRAVAEVLEALPEGLPDEVVADVAEAALRQVVRCHVVIQTGRMARANEPGSVSLC